MSTQQYTNTTSKSAKRDIKRQLDHHIKKITFLQSLISSEEEEVFKLMELQKRLFTKIPA